MKYIGRLVNILADHLWIRTLYCWEYDLHRTDAPWRSPDDGTIHWSLATIEDCRNWSQLGGDGFSKDDCELLIRLIEQGHFVLTGRGVVDQQVPDCYAACVTGRKPMTHRCFFQMLPGEGAIRTVYTRMAVRGRGLATRLYAQMCRTASERGFDRLYVDIDSSNRASIRAAEKAGAFRIEKTTIYELRWLKRSYLLVCGTLRTRFLVSR